MSDLKPRCPECGAFVKKDGTHRADAFTECSLRKTITAAETGGPHSNTRTTFGGKIYNTLGWENRRG